MRQRAYLEISKRANPGSAVLAFERRSMWTQHIRGGVLAGSSSVKCPRIHSLTKTQSVGRCGKCRQSLVLGRTGFDVRVHASAAVSLGDGKTEKRPSFPFCKIAGQEDMKLALLLNIVDRNIGGVLIMGDRGTGKSMAVRGDFRI